MSSRRPLLIAFACSWMPFIAGCGGADHPDVFPVTGTVTYKGQPVADAVVAFHGEAGNMATGKTDAQGRFQLTTYEPGDGAAPGVNQVTVSKFVTSGGGSGGTSTMEEAAKAAETAEPVTEKNELPAKFADVGGSQLQFTVKEGENDFKIELND